MIAPCSLLSFMHHLVSFTLYDDLFLLHGLVTTLSQKQGRAPSSIANTPMKWKEPHQKHYGLGF